jgi:hypothetical protein
MEGMIMSYEPYPFGRAGQSVWNHLTGEIEWAEHELLVVEQICRLYDTQAILASEAVKQPILIDGSTGQPRLCPLWPELRHVRLAIAALVKQLRLDEEEEAAPARGANAMTTQRAQDMARARWQRKVSV